MTEKINYSEIDPNIKALVKVLNSFDGITTIGSCGGHPNPTGGQWPEDRWYVKFDISWDDNGYFALEFLAWLLNDDIRQGVFFGPTAPPPYLNTPGKGLKWVIEGHNKDPEELAKVIKKIKRECFISPDTQPPTEGKP